jgi:diguanylate cyclase (GGDEF)-like protein
MQLDKRDSNYLSYKEKYAKNIYAELNKHLDLNKALTITLKKIQEFTNIEATAIRLAENSDYTYFVHSGFPRSFIKSENSIIASDENGNKLLSLNKKSFLRECMCANIIKAKFDPSLPYFTKGGSFWSNNTTELLANTSEKENMAKYRNYCNHSGYESVALIPIKTNGVCLGLLQLNDKRKDIFFQDLIEFLENIGKQIGFSVQINLKFNKIKKASNKIKLTNTKLKILANKNHLTGLFNRRLMLKMLELEKNRSIRNKKHFTLIMADIDHFKKINDLYGHDAGDKFLISTSKILVRSIRKSDVVSRWGGDEFLILLPETDKSGGSDLANKLLEIFRKKVFKYSNNKINLTMSFGVFEYIENKNLNECIKSADNLLFRAKETGRNRVVTIDNYS